MNLDNLMNDAGDAKAAALPERLSPVVDWNLLKKAIKR